MMKEKLRPVYFELKGYLTQFPTSEIKYIIYDEPVWKQYNDAVKLVVKISEKEDYSRFLIIPSDSVVGPYVELFTYQQKLYGLISRLQGEYFSDEPSPFGGTPNTVITQSQQQNQSVHIQMLLDIQSKVDEKIPKYPEGSKENNFLQKFKSMLSSMSNITQLFSHFFKTAKEFGLNIDDITEIFK